MANRTPHPIIITVILILILLILSPRLITFAQADDTAADSQLTTYTVESGDTLFAIARRFDVTPQSLIDANNIDDPNLLFVGQQLTIPISAPPASTPAPSVTPTSNITPTLSVTPTLSPIAMDRSGDADRTLLTCGAD